MSPAATIYLVTNTVNGHRYIGVTRFSVQKRWQEHRANAARGLDTRLSSALRKYGADAFTIEAVASCLTLADAGGVERALIQQIRPVYNQTNGGEITSGRRVALDVAERIRTSNLGKKRTAEQCARIARAKSHQYATNPALRAANRSRLIAMRAMIDEPTRRARAAHATRTRVWTDASRAKLSASCMGRRHSQEVIDRIRMKRFKPVMCETLDMTFGCVDEASIRLGVPSTAIYKTCAGARKNVNGLVFSYVGSR